MAIKQVKMTGKAIEGLPIIPPKLSENEKELLNLIAEIVVQLIIKDTEHECNRICKNK